MHVIYIPFALNNDNDHGSTLQAKLPGAVRGWTSRIGQLHHRCGQKRATASIASALHNGRQLHEDHHYSQPSARDGKCN